jgi:hypothetical protein
MYALSRCASRRVRLERLEYLLPQRLRCGPSRERKQLVELIEAVLERRRDRSGRRRMRA